MNLIVGKNNVGKSSVLEALRIYASSGQPQVLWEGITARDEHKQTTRVGQTFHGMFHDNSLPPEVMEFGPTGDKLQISPKSPSETPPDDLSESNGAELHLTIKSGGMPRTIANSTDSLAWRLRRGQFGKEIPPKLPCVFVAANGSTQERQAELWDEAILQSLDGELITSLQLIVPSLDKVALIGNKEEQGRTAFARWGGNKTPLPLKRLGEGVNRLFGMALALVNSQGGLLLLDEIENGIHYSVQESLWRFILEVSKRLDVQVFATSHSWDSIKAFQRAIVDDSGEGLVTRLEMREGLITASEFNEEELEIAVREEIEIR